MGSRLPHLAAVLLLATLLSSAAQGRTDQRPVPVLVEQLMPGVTYEQDVDYSPHGAVTYHVITAPAPGGLYSLSPVLAGGTVTGPTESLAQLEQSVSTTATVAGINGDFFSTHNGRPTGIYMQGGVIANAPASLRSSIGIDSSGSVHVKRFKFVGTWHGTGQHRPLNGINQTPTAGQVVLFTPAWGATTPVIGNAAEAVIEPFPSATPNTDLNGTVTAVSTAGGGTTIPADGAVLMAVGTTIGAKLQAEAAVGTTVTARITLPDDWSNVTGAIGGGPLLVKNGKAVFHTTENFAATDLTLRTARAGIGQLADGRIVLVAVDGGQPGYSAGVTTYELAKEMVALGAQTASAVSFGGPVAAAFDGTLLSRPSGPVAGQALKDALLVEYYGVYAPPPSSPVVSGGATEQLAYKVVRPSTVTATLVGPDGQSAQIDTGSKAPGTYSFTSPPFTQEGTWHWHVVATDDLGRQSTADQTFRYDLTLSALRVPSSVSRKQGLTVHFSLSRSATVTLTIQTKAGAVVGVGLPQADPAGPGTLHWDGTLDGSTPAYPGAYVARVTATSSIGTMDLSAPFALLI
jgi:hypothetical protein